MSSDEKAGFGDVETIKQGQALPASTTSAHRGQRLHIMGDGTFRTIALPSSGTVIIGRGKEADVRIDDPAISRQHALLHVQTASIAVEDLGSANGTLIRGAKLEPKTTVEVLPGEAIEVGGYSLLVERDGAGAAQYGPGEYELSKSFSGNAVIVEAPAMQSLHRLIERIAAGSISVLVLGETGVGKEVIAETIHRRSPRRDKPFVRLNCAALSDTLIESELFGHEKGAFTGAIGAKPGLLETAQEGTLFLDEVGELPMSTQVKLLRVLEERMVLRVGALKPRAIDVRIISATNRNLETEIAAGRFRQDLYFRLNGISIAVPPLRERTLELQSLVRLFVKQVCRQDGRSREPQISAEALESMRLYAWPGNIRELRNVIERAVLLCDGDSIEPEDLPLEKMAPNAATLPPRPSAENSGVLSGEMQAFERERIIAALEKCSGNQTQAAKSLGIARRTLIKRLDQYKIERPRKAYEDGE